MRTAIYFGLLILVAGVSYLLGASNNTGHREESSAPKPSQGAVDLEFAAKNYPRGELGIPAQWFIMDTIVGAEKVMLIFGYADNKSVCEHTLELAKVESPMREFRCEDAN